MIVGWQCHPEREHAMPSTVQELAIIVNNDESALARLPREQGIWCSRLAQCEPVSDRYGAVAAIASRRESQVLSDMYGRDIGLRIALVMDDTTCGYNDSRIPVPLHIYAKTTQQLAGLGLDPDIAIPAELGPSCASFELQDILASWLDDNGMAPAPWTPKGWTNTNNGI